MSKPELRNRRAVLSFSEKVRILEKLRGRSRSPGSDAPELHVNRGFASAGRHTERNKQPYSSSSFQPSRNFFTSDINWSATAPSIMRWS